jgi:hypothetical protein
MRYQDDFRKRNPVAVLPVKMAVSQNCLFLHEALFPAKKEAHPENGND